LGRVPRWTVRKALSWVRMPSILLSRGAQR
jgi:hypothetical protein